MADYQLKSGPADVVASGTVIAFGRSPIEIEYGPDERRLRVVLRFTDEQGKDDLRVEAKRVDESTLELNLFNFKNPLGAGSITPIEIGNLEGRRFYINFRVHELSGGDKTLHFSVYELQGMRGDG